MMGSSIRFLLLVMSLATSLEVVGAQPKFKISQSVFPHQAKKEDCNFGCKYIPDLSKSFLEFGKSSQNTLSPQSIGVLIWNVHKAMDDGFDQDIKKFAQSNDILLLQEVRKDPLFLSLDDLFWKMGVAFVQSDNVETGTSVASRVLPVYSGFKRTEDRELFVQSPKTQTYAVYPLAKKSEGLLVISIHGILSRRTSILERQMKQVSDLIQNHTGPVIYAGDFNTRNSDRHRAVRKFMNDRGLDQVHFEKDSRKSPLDHVFTRGLMLQESKLYEKIKSSDHPALQVRMMAL